MNPEALEVFNTISRYLLIGTILTFIIFTILRWRREDREEAEELEELRRKYRLAGPPPPHDSSVISAYNPRRNVTPFFLSSRRFSSLCLLPRFRARGAGVCGFGGYDECSGREHG